MKGEQVALREIKIPKIIGILTKYSLSASPELLKSSISHSLTILRRQQIPRQAIVKMGPTQSLKRIIIARLTSKTPKILIAIQIKPYSFHQSYLFDWMLLEFDLGEDLTVQDQGSLVVIVMRPLDMIVGGVKKEGCEEDSADCADGLWDVFSSYHLYTLVLQIIANRIDIELILFKEDSYIIIIQICLNLNLATMTTFERFQRDSRSRLTSNSASRSQHRSPFVTNNPNNHNSRPSSSSLKNKVNFSSPEIHFTMSKNYSSFSLKVANYSGSKIYYKVRCNNSEEYAVMPYEEVIGDHEEKVIVFEWMAVKGRGKGGRERRDKFQIIWGRVPGKPGQPTIFTESRIFPVVFQKGEQDFPSNQFYNSMPRQNMSTSRRYENNNTSEFGDEVSYGSPMKKGKTSDPSAKSGETLLTKNNIIIVSVVSFVLGFILT